MRRVGSLRSRRIARTFRDARLEGALRRDGFVVVQLVDAAAATELGAAVSRSAAPGDDRTGLFNDSWATDRSFVRARSSLIDGVLGPCVARTFVGHDPLIWGTSVKWPGDDGVVPAHRDPTFVDEGRYRSVGVWCAVDEVDERRGTLEVLPGSHRPDREIRVHQSTRNLIPSLGPDVERRFETISLTPGQAIVYDHSLVHRSGPNLGTGPRVVVMTHLVPQESDVRYAVPVGADRAAVLSVDQEFFLGQQVDRLDVEDLLRNYTTLSTVEVAPGFGAVG